MTNLEAIVRDYLRKAKASCAAATESSPGEIENLAMLMMAEKILLLNDALACAQIAAGPDPFAAVARGESR